MPIIRNFDTLSKREREILALYPRHAVYKTIAHAIGLSEQTVKNHVSSCIAKLGTENFGQAALFYDRHTHGGWEMAIEVGSESGAGSILNAWEVIEREYPLATVARLRAALAAEPVGAGLREVAYAVADAWDQRQVKPEWMSDLNHEIAHLRAALAATPEEEEA
jgi:DNA-binding CsgD family transcriptional regulator